MGLSFSAPTTTTTADPISFVHVEHAEVDPSSPVGLKGLPLGWERFLLVSGVTKEEILKNPDTVLRIMNGNAKMLLDETPIKNASHTPVDAISTLKKWKNKAIVPLPSSKEVNEKMSWENNVKVYDDIDEVYPVRNVIGSGSSGTVYVTGTKDEKNGGGVIALKVMEIYQLGDPESESGIDNEKEAVLNEIALMKLCQECNQILHFYEAFSLSGMEERQLWIAMEYMPGGTLAQLLTACAPTGFSDQITAYILRETLLALAFLHKNHRIHRDLKCDNMLLSLDGAVKLADFGFCAQLTKEIKKRRSVCGTPYYMSPECVEGQEYDMSADIWSFGILGLECAEGQPPNKDVPPFRAMFLITTTPPPTLKQPSAHSPLLAEFLALCLQKDSAQRATAKKLLEHPFLKLACKKEELVPLIAKSREAMHIQDGL